jgi:metal-responsive CopG/Arc/MetJ family transcriptional regulator
MATRKRSGRVKKKQNGTRESPARRYLIMFEQMQGQMQALHEALFSVRDELIRRFEDRFERLEARIAILEVVVQKNSADIQKNSADIQKNSADIQKNTEQIALLTQKLSELTEVVRGKADEAALRKLETRLVRVEQHLGLPPPV